MLPLKGAAAAREPDRAAMAKLRSKGGPRPQGWGAWVPLEFRGASGALDTEHGHRNLPTRGSHIKTDDLSRDVQPHPMATLTDEQRRALRLLARSPKGCTEAILLAHGFELAMLGDGLAKVEARDTMAGSRRMKVFWLQITAAGRKAIAG
jgi:hypothetical protein